MIRVAVVGLGWWGQHIISRLAGEQCRLRVVLGVDAHPERVRDFMSAQRVDLADDFGTALERPDVDAVILATPHALHEEQVTRAARAGRHVFCEKPLALSRASAERAVAACADAGVVLGIGHERRFEPAMLALKDLVDNGDLGTILHVEAAFSHDKLAGLSPENWRASIEHGPAVALTGMGVHLTDSWIQMFGPLDTVYAQRARRVTEIATGDVVCVQARLRSGVTGFLSALLVTPFFIRYHVFGSDAWAQVIDSAHPDDAKHTACISVQTSGAETWTREFSGVDAVVANLETFAAAAEGKAAYPVSTEQLLANVSALEAIGRSFETGRVEQVS